MKEPFLPGIFMARSYHIDIARFAADADRKWVDNLLSAFAIPGVQSARRGVARRISTSGIQHIALVRRLSHDLGVSVDTGVSLAHRLLRSEDTGCSVAAQLELRLDRRAFEREIESRIELAVESIVPARRGRPPMQA
jgi:hypothetical protein